MNEITEVRPTVSTTTKSKERGTDNRSIARSGTLMSRTMRNRPQNEDALRGMELKPLTEAVDFEYPVHLLPSVMKTLTSKYGGRLQTVNVQMVKSNQYRVAFSLNSRVGGDE